MLTEEQDLLEYKKQQNIIIHLSHSVACLYISKREKKKTPTTFAQTHTQAKHTNIPQTHKQTQIFPSHSYCSPAMEQEEVVADVKHQFPG